MCLCYSNGKLKLDGDTDVDIVTDIDSRKSTSEYMMTFVGGSVSLQSKLQKCVALSITVAEYIATVEACKEALWLKKLLKNLRLEQEKYNVYCDSQSAINLNKN